MAIRRPYRIKTNLESAQTQHTEIEIYDYSLTLPTLELEATQTQSGEAINWAVFVEGTIASTATLTGDFGGGGGGLPLIAQYSFENTSWLDSIGSRHLTETGSGMQSVSGGQSGNCASFPSINGGLQRINSDMSLNDSDWRIEFYFRLPSLGAFDLMAIGDNDFNTLGEFYCRVVNVSGNYRVRLSIYDEFFGEAAIVTNTVNLTATTWHLCKIGLNGSNAFVDVNGTEVTGALSDTAAVNSNPAFYFAADDSGSANRAANNLRLDEVQIYK